MQKYTDLVLGLNGQTLVPVVGASVTVLTYPGGASATIYSDNGITTTSNPLTTDSTGRFSFYAANGRYSLRVSYQTVTYTIQDIPLLDDPSNGQSAIITGGSIDNTPIGSTTPSTGAFTTLSASSMVSGAGFTSFLASPPAIGATAPNTGAFTTLTGASLTLSPQAGAPSSNGQIVSSSSQLALQAQAGGLNSYLPGVIYSQTSATSTSGTSASSWIGTGVGTVTLPANYLVAGKTIRIKAGGVFATAATPGTITLNVTVGSSTLFSSAAVTPNASLSVVFFFEAVVTIRTVGSSGTQGNYGTIAYATGNNAAPLLLFGQLVGSGSINTTVANTIGISTTNSVASGAVFTIDTLVIEALN